MHFAHPAIHRCYRRRTAHSNGFTMKDDKQKHEGQTRTGAKNPRQDRLKLALRENLKRRKSQARGRGDIVAPSNQDDVPPHDGDGKKPGE
jgi:hypothetical protein